jgi:hypothetical protein
MREHALIRKGASESAERERRISEAFRRDDVWALVSASRAVAEKVRECLASGATAKASRAAARLLKASRLAERALRGISPRSLRTEDLWFLWDAERRELCEMPVAERTRLYSLLLRARIASVPGEYRNCCPNAECGEHWEVDTDSRCVCKVCGFEL